VTDRRLRGGPSTAVDGPDRAPAGEVRAAEVMVSGSPPVRVLRVGTRRELALLVGVGFAVMLMIGVGAVVATRSVAQQQALEDSERITGRLANLVTKPLWTGYPPREPAKYTELQRDLRARMADGNLTEVTVWSADGTVLLSDKNEDIGKKLPPPEQLARALAGETTSDFEDGQPEADANNPTTPDKADQTGGHRFVEVYTPLDVAGQPRMVFEAYYDYDRVSQLADRLLGQALPLVLIPLLILQLVQIPIAISLARRIKRHETDRSRLLERALTASDRERVRFAADLHDGPIQELAGIGYVLGAIAPTVIERHAPLMARVQDALQRSIESLRGLMTDLYPPDLRGGNLSSTIATLADQLRNEGIDVQLNLAEVPTLTQEAVATLYRVTRESLANVHKHAQASTVQITLQVLHGLHGTNQPWIRLVIADDGVGVDPARIDRRAEGHLGLRLLIDRVESMAGELLVTSTPGHGTTVQAELPVASSTLD
jgi:two-component system NarL family sensor kinase